MRLVAIIVDFGTPDHTRSAVHSLLSSHRRPDRILVIENTPDGIGVVDGVERVRSGRNLGFAGGANLGVRASLAGGADALLLLNSDARVAPDCLERLESALRPPDVGMAAPAILRDSGEVESLGLLYDARTGRMRHVQKPCRVDGLSGAAMLVKRATFERVGLLDEEYFMYFEDVDFCLRAREQGLRSVCVPEAVAHHDGARSIGPRSPRRVYFATRNHLRLASRTLPLPAAFATVRAAGIVGLNLAHLFARAPCPLGPGLLAVGRGTWDHMRGRYGSAE